jgi:hypothetical protein
MKNEFNQLKMDFSSEYIATSKVNSVIPKTKEVHIVNSNVEKLRARSNEILNRAYIQEQQKKELLYHIIYNEKSF